MYLKPSVVYRVFVRIRMPALTIRMPMYTPTILPRQKPHPPTCARCGRVGHVLNECKAVYDVNGLDIE